MTLHITTKNAQKVGVITDITGIKNPILYSLETGLEQPVSIAGDSLNFLLETTGKSKEDLKLLSAKMVGAQRGLKIQDQMHDGDISFSLESGLKVCTMFKAELPALLLNNKDLQRQYLGIDDELYHLVLDYTVAIIQTSHSTKLISGESADSCIFPWTAFAKAAKTEGNFVTTTVGSILATDLGLDGKNPHKDLPSMSGAMKGVFTPIDRSVYMKQAAQAAWKKYHNPNH
jgi:hypothetical protein